MRSIVTLDDDDGNYLPNRPSEPAGQGSGNRDALLGGGTGTDNVSFVDRLRSNLKLHSGRIRERIINTYGEDAQSAEEQEALRRIEDE